MDTLSQAIKAGKGIVDRGFVFLDSHLHPEEVSHDSIFRIAKNISLYLRSRGLTKGDRLGLVIPANKEFVFWFLGAVYAGIVPVPLYPPIPGGRLDGYLDILLKILNSCEARMVVTTTRLSIIKEVLLKGCPALDDTIFIEEIVNLEREDESSEDDEVEIVSSDTCLIQYTSGSTADPKGVVIRHANITSNACGLIKSLRSDEKRIAVSWLPLYHDMGLMLVMLPILIHSKVVLISPITFVTRPQIWMQTISAYRATTTASPNFGLALASKYTNHKAKLDLSCLDAVICGAEAINPETVRRFVETFEPSGFRRNAIVAAYGMAEATLCVTHDDADRPFHTILIDRYLYEKKGIVREVLSAKSSECIEVVSCGRTLPGHEVAIMREDGTLAEEAEVGEVVFRGPSVTTGYWGTREANSKLFKGKWMVTGDLGFILGGELFISARKKDLIIVAGRNYQPQSIEWTVEKVEGIRKGNVIAFSVFGDDTERVIVVSECSARGSMEQLAEAVKARVAEEIGTKVQKVVFVEKGTLPKTSSGKLRRGAAKIAYETGTLKSITVV